MQTSYLQNVIDTKRLKNTARKVVKFIKNLNIEFDAIAFRGSSGALLAPIVAMRLNKGMIMVRKEPPHTNAHHSWLKVEGDVDAPKYLILDDQICSGSTIRTIRKDINAAHDKQTECVGIVLYEFVMRFIEPDCYQPWD